ncbi:MAG: hypothetical protein U0840_09270 [Gemmataceae bacterium]
MTRKVALVLILVLVLVGLGRAWWVIGHASVAEAATKGLPDDIPVFFRAAARQLGHLAGEPDRWKNPSCKHLRAAESPDHFIDLEDYEGNPLPPDRWKAIALLQKLKRSPDRVGFLPYAILENYDRLSVAFYDYRADPKDPAVQAKAIVYAGVLAHLTGDSVMPLHTTRNYDGRRNKEGKFVQKGIHAKIDAFPEKQGLTAEEISRGLKAKKIDDVWEHVLKTIQESHEQIEKCYQLDQAGAFEKPTKESRQFILDRCRAGAQLTMDLWYTAWVRSATMPKHY